ncbi:MAG: competence protein CoiA family protein [Thermoactinomyces sp.]
MKKTGIRAKYRRQYGAIPYGISSTGKIVLPKEAVHQKTYHCPECKGKVILRMSRLKNPYFSHTPGKNRICKLNRSTVALAKHVLRLALGQWINGKGNPVEVQLFIGKRYELPQNLINEIKLDQRICFHQKRGFHSHITLIDHYGQTLLNIELREEARKRHVKHPSWLEVSAEEILDNPCLLSSLDPHMNTPYFLQPVQLNLF